MECKEPLPDFWTTFHNLQNTAEPFCCVTLAETTGSVPGQAGAKLLVTMQGLAAGTVGGGRLEARVLDIAKGMLGEDKNSTRYERWNLQTEFGMTCGGMAGVLFETYSLGGWNIVIFGAGHVSQALTRVLLPLDCRLTCYDTRQEWLDRLPQDTRLQKIHSASLADDVEKLSTNSFVILMTMGHATDLPILRQILTRDFPYVGVIGSKNKAAALRKDLARDDVPIEKCHSFFCPIGLPIGTHHPQEIAISIAAQLLQERG